MQQPQDAPTLDPTPQPPHLEDKRPETATLAVLGVTSGLSGPQQPLDLAVEGEAMKSWLRVSRGLGFIHVFVIQILFAHFF